MLLKRIAASQILQVDYIEEMIETPENHVYGTCGRVVADQCP
jgi:hypothetical protein